MALQHKPMNNENSCLNNRSRQLNMEKGEAVSPELTPKHTLVASVLSTHKFGCFTGMMAVLELLIAILMRRGGADAEDRIEAYDNHRTANHAYWSTQKKH